MATETEQLCTFLSSLSYDDIPPNVIEHAKASILNALGCALGGASASPAIKARKAMLPLTSSKTSTIIARPERTDIQTAALLNGIALTNADYDDTHLRTVIHPSGAVLCAILAWGESHQMSGKDILLAFIVGVEAQLRVGNSISPGHYTNGWHVTGTTGSFGAAAAMSKLLGLSPLQFKYAFGHAASLAGGTRSANGTDTKTLHMGRGAQNGITTAVLAQQNFDTGAHPIEYWGKLVSTTVHMSYLTQGLGKQWELSQNTFKPYPCGIVIHPLIDGCISFHERGVRAEDIERIEVVVNPQCVRLCFIRHPKTFLQGIFSLYHGCAVGVLYGAGDRRQFTDEVCNRSEVVSIRDKIEVQTDGSLRDDEALLKVFLRNGKVDEEHVAHAKGSLRNPLTQDQLEQKLIDQSEDAIGIQSCKKVITMCWKLDEIEDINQLLELCRTK